MEDLYIKGTNKFDAEMEYGLRIPEQQRVLVKSKNQVQQERVITLDDGPSEEIIASHFDSKIIY